MHKKKEKKKRKEKKEEEKEERIDVNKHMWSAWKKGREGEGACNEIRVFFFRKEEGKV